MLNRERLGELLRYEPDTGQFYWLAAAGRVSTGHEAGCLDDTVLIRIDKRLYRGHYLAVLYMTGEWPSSRPVHINGDKSDNRWENLRV